MGRMEKEVMAEIRRSKINTAVVSTLAVGGMLAVGLVAPNVLGAMGKLGLINAYQKKQSVKKSLTKLIERGYVVIENGAARLTQKGEAFAARMGEGKLTPKKPRRWDGKWRLLMFDIPEKRKRTRDRVRTTLMGLGFKRLQDSVWMYPYDCEDLIALLKVDFHIGKDLLYIIADKVENDTALRSKFDL